MKYFPNQSFFHYIVTWRLKIPVVTMNEEFCHKVWKSLSFLRRDRTLIYTISIHKVRKQNLLPYSEKMEETIYNYNAWICYCLWTWNHFLSIIVKITHTKRILNFQLIWWVLLLIIGILNDDSNSYFLWKKILTSNQKFHYFHMLHENGLFISPNEIEIAT